MNKKLVVEIVFSVLFLLSTLCVFIFAFGKEATPASKGITLVMFISMIIIVGLYKVVNISRDKNKGDNKEDGIDG